MRSLRVSTGCRSQRGFMGRRAAAAILLLFVCTLATATARLSGGNHAQAKEVESESMDIAYLGFTFTINLTGTHFSAREVSEIFCSRYNLDPSHHRSVRELVENAVVEHIGVARLNQVWYGDGDGGGGDAIAAAVVDGVCRDFPGLHGMPYDSLTRRAHPARILDAFPFFNELDILDLRLRELSGVAAKFILVESSMTHSGSPKNLTFDLNKQRFGPYLEDIVHVIIDQLPDSPDPWVRERSQREGIHEGLRVAEAHEDDIIIVSDADEIPRRSTLRALSWCSGYRSPLQLRSAFYYYSFRHRWSKQDGVVGDDAYMWNQPRAFIFSQLDPPRLGVNQIRYDTGEGNMEVVAHASWHLSFWGGTERIREKIEAYAHQENNIDAFKSGEHIERAVGQGHDLFGRGDVHGSLSANTEPYDLPSPVLQDMALGRSAEWVSYLPESFDVGAFAGTTTRRIEHDEL